jgi:hypothetical protein
MIASGERNRMSYAAKAHKGAIRNSGAAYKDFIRTKVLKL